mgnify:FL=1
MKIVKLDRRHKLYLRGFTYAFKCSYSNESVKVYAITRYLESVYGHNRLDRSGAWYGGFGTSRMTVKNLWGGEYTTNPYWIAVRREADVTAILLATEL